MKVVLFCGGMGMRMRDYSESIPKPMVPIGPHPILWHLMEYYAAFGHTDFILCLGYRGDAIRSYFGAADGADEAVLRTRQGRRSVRFVESGLDASVGERLGSARALVGDDPWFLANYADGLSDIPLEAVVDFARRRDLTATLVGVPPTQSFHLVHAEPDGRVTRIEKAADSGHRVNGGFFVLRNDVFDHLRPGEDLVDGAFARLMEVGRVGCYAHDGFWACMDTYKEKQILEDIHATGNAPWMRVGTERRMTGRSPARRRGATTIDRPTVRPVPATAGPKTPIKLAVDP